MEGGSYEVKVNTTVPVYLERPSISGDDIYDNFLLFWEWKFMRPEVEVNFVSTILKN